MRRLLWLLALAACGNAWRTPDQQGRQLYEAGAFAEAAKRFEDHLWRGAALVAAKDFKEAAEAFRGSPTADGFYNLGVCLALLGRYEEARGAFDGCLAVEPAHEDAAFNRGLVDRLLAAKDVDVESPETDYVHYSPDEIRFDEKGKKGREGEVDQMRLTPVQAGELWLRQIRTTPADFLRRKFAIQAQR